jgi:voltage-gated potassium channel Kch
MGIPCVYGDISHRDTLEHAGVEEAKVLISSISDDFLRGTSNLTLLKQLRGMNPHATIIVRAEKVADARAMYDAGADYVLLPRHLVAEHVREILRRIEEGTLSEARAAERAALERRREVVP